MGFMVDWGRIVKSKKEMGRPTVFPCTEICTQQSLFSGFLFCYPEQPRLTWRDNWIKMEKKQICESDSWFWLPPTERVKKFIVSVDTWFLVIYCLLLLFLKLFSYFILKGGCERSLSSPLELAHALAYKQQELFCVSHFLGRACEWNLRRLSQ